MPRGLWDRAYLGVVIDKAWGEFIDAWAGVPESAMLEPGVVDGWSVKDLIAHVAVWEDEAVKNLPFVVEGKRPPRYGGVDNFNAGRSEAINRLSLADARKRSRDSHKRLLTYLDGVDASWYQRESRFRHRLRLDTWAHYREHAQAVLDWRKERGV